MLIGFSVSNFRSFNSPQSISFKPSKIARHKKHLCEIAGKKVLKSAVIYGANAGGKSNLIKAIDFSRNIILNGVDSASLSKMNFRISSETFTIPGTFQYQLIAGEYEYSYGIAISYSKSEIISEWLVRIDKNKNEFVIFDRNVNEDKKSIVETDISAKQFKDSERLRIYFEDFSENISDTLRKKTMLSDLATRGSHKDTILNEIVAVYEWFKKILILFPESKYIRINDMANDSQRDFFRNVLQYFDTGIDELKSQQRGMDLDKLFENIPHADAEQLKVQISLTAGQHPFDIRIDNQLVTLRKDETGNIVYNKLMFDHGNPDDPFDLTDESDGTRRLFDFIPLLHEIGSNHVILIDEIDRSLHTSLVRKFFEIFFEKTERNSSQIIATTHDDNIMDLDLFRQDEIWFVERQPDHSSYLYSLNKYKARFDKKVNNDYLLGKYGAIPQFQKKQELEVING